MVLSREVENAKSFADKNMYNKKPDCCEKIAFRFFVITDASDSAYNTIKVVADKFSSTIKPYICQK